MDISIGPWQIGNDRQSTPGGNGARGSRGWLGATLPHAPVRRVAPASASPALEWWSSLSRAERIATLSILVGGVVAIVCFVAWAIAAGYIARQNARAALMEDELYSIEAGELPEGLSAEEDAAVGGRWSR